MSDDRRVTCWEILMDEPLCNMVFTGVRAFVKVGGKNMVVAIPMPYEVVTDPTTPIERWVREAVEAMDVH
jgi:hypothetical protein